MQFYHVLGNRLLPLAGVCLVACFAAQVAAELQPYQARVTVARAQVRSGPGENFYPTDTLAQGETVEVYREQPGGWLAIRPTKESFSWVFARHLKVRGDGLGEIDKDYVASRIGSRFGNQRNAVQVQLRKGEVVEILGEENERGETWYKIAPPAGEFRWLQASNLKPIGPIPLAEHGAEPAVVAASAENENQADKPTADKREPSEDKPAAVSAESGVPPREDWRAAPDASTASSVATTLPPAAAPTTTPSTVTTPSVPQPVAQQGSAAPASQLPDQLARHLTDIELRLSRMVAAPPSQWNTERLERDTEELLTQAQTAEERDAIKATLAKLDHFASIAHRVQQKRVGEWETGIMEGEQISPSPPLPVSPSGFDAVGILRPVVSKRPGAPQFALVDDRGQVISFVTPTPDMNLQPYVGHRVGVVGTRGFIAEFRRAHVTAGRVTPLSERLVR